MHIMLRPDSGMMVLSTQHILVKSSVWPSQLHPRMNLNRQSLEYLECKPRSTGAIVVIVRNTEVDQ